MTRTFGELPVSATTAGAGIGMAVGSIIPGLGTAVGYGVGAAIGGIVDLFGSAKKMRKERQKMQQAFYASLIKRYNNQVFSSCLEELGSAMLRIQGLGIKPGTPAFEQMLQKQLSTGDCIYSPKEAFGPCGVDLFKLDSGKLRAIATIQPSGKMQTFDPNMDQALGTNWRTACHELQLKALEAWAQDLKETMSTQQEVDQAKADEQRSAVTRLLVNAGILALMFGYILRQKSKLRKYREFKSGTISE